jgi:hypothetical protein
MKKKTMEEIENQNKNLKEALDYAKSIIWNYEADIKATRETFPSLPLEKDLADYGFCQGVAYREALSDIERMERVGKFN